LWVLQDSIDLVAGHYQVTPGAPSPYQISLKDSLAVSDIRSYLRNE
jgi:hypothetical protein